MQHLGEPKHTVAVSIHPRNNALEQTSPSFYVQKHSRHSVLAEVSAGSCVTGSLYALVWHYHLGSISTLVVEVSAGSVLVELLRTRPKDTLVSVSNLTGVPS